LPKFNDLTGRIFGELTVINRTDDYIDSKGRKYVVWNCLCSCGNYIKVQSRILTNNNTKHCGCKDIDLTGQKINAWTVLRKDKNGWFCQCQCGNTGVISTNNLLNNKSKSCGCSSWFDLIDKKLGRLTVIKYAETINNHSYVWCKCDCGNEKKIKVSDLNKKYKPTRSCGCINKERIGKLNFVDITGKKYGKWTVIKYNNNGNWLCKCECGTEKSMKASTLNSGLSKGCRNCFKFDIDDHFFDIIDSEEKAYILGFLYADGYNNNKYKRIKIDLQSDDENILVKIKHALQYTGEILHYDFKTKIFNGKEYKVKPTSRLNLYSENLSNQLVDKGCIQNKTYKVDFPNNDILPIYLYNHFIRGLIDGDGHIGYWIDNKKTGHKKFSLSLTGTTEIIHNVCKIIVEKFNCKPDLRSRFKDRDNNNLTMSICGNKVIEGILDWLYSDSNIYLDRKYNKYIELKEQNNKTMYNQNNTYCMRKVIQLDLNYILINEYKSLQETEKDGFNSSSIGFACKGKFKNNSHQHKGFLWYYKDDYELLVNKEEII